MDNKKPKAAFFAGRPNLVDRVYGEERKGEVEKRCDLYPVVIGMDNFAEHADRLRDMEYIFSTWSMPSLGDHQIRELTSLKTVFYAAGSVQSFARPFLRHGVKVVSAWAANAIPVAEFCLAQILLGCKGYFRNIRDCATPPSNNHFQSHQGPGIYGNTVGLIGFGMIGRKLADMLRPYNLNVLVVDPYVTDEVIAAHGARRSTLDEVFRTAHVVSNHLPNLPATVGMLGEEHFKIMQPFATFINTGRGKQVREADMIKVLREREDLTALLDVTHPEPPLPDSPFFELSNVLLTSHIAGSIGNEVHRMADFILEEYDRMIAGDPLKYEVSEAMLETMA